jgi:2-polyprenyl-6-methoxyphenol hydroxylase-like FAD-dependent oxidoreductase
MQDLFLGQLPKVWTDAIADALIAHPEGFSMGGNVFTSKLASPEVIPSVVLVGDAGHATSWRLGYSLETALGTAAALGRSLRASDRLSEALCRLNDERQGNVSALSQIDRLVCSRFSCPSALSAALLHDGLHLHEDGALPNVGNLQVQPVEST